jgi:hypothetical protein
MKRAQVGRGATMLAGLVLGLAVMVGVPAAWGQEELYVANRNGDSITVYARTASGDAAPIRTIQGGATGLNRPIGVAVDAVHGELVIGNSNGSITVYPRSATDNVPPLRSITGDLFSGVAVDTVHDEIVALGASAVKVYARTASGAAGPLRTITGVSTGLNGPTGLAVDLVHDEIIVSSTNNNSIRVYPRSATGDVAPLRTIVGPATGMNAPAGIALDLVHDEIVVADPFSAAVRVFPRRAAGNVAPLRTLSGLATGVADPHGVALDLAHDELIVTNQFGGRLPVHARTASGNATPLRTITGPSTEFNAPQFPAVTTSPPLVAAVLPVSRSVRVGTAATAFAAIINAGAGPVQQCAVTPITSVPGTHAFQTTNASNQLVGTVNTPATINARGTQNFVLAFVPSAAFGPADVRLGFACDGTNAAPVISGLSTLVLVASFAPVPDLIALAATVSNDGIVNVPGTTGTGAFAVATANVGVGGTITVSADTGATALPVTLTVCQTDTSAACLAPAAPTVTLFIDAGTTPTFSVFARASEMIPFEPAVNRVFLRFKDGDNVIRGATSAAIRTQ